MAERRPLVLKDGRREEMPAGDTLPADVIPDLGDNYARWTPTLIPEGETFTVPEHTQMLIVQGIKVDGTLIVEGVIIDAAPDTQCGPAGPTPPAPGIGDPIPALNLSIPSGIDPEIWAYTLSDDSDVTYNSATLPMSSVFRFDRPTEYIVGFYVDLRMSYPHGATVEVGTGNTANSEFGLPFSIRTSPASATAAYANESDPGIANVRVGPFYRQAGGAWSPDELGKVYFDVDVTQELGTSGDVRVYELSMVAMQVATSPTPGVEDLPVAAVEAIDGEWATVGAPETFEGVVEALNTPGQSTGLVFPEQDPPDVDGYETTVSLRFAEPQHHDGRNIESFRLHVLGYPWINANVVGDEEGQWCRAEPGIDATPTTRLAHVRDDAFVNGATYNYTQPFTKSGGGSWTPEEFGELVVDITQHWSGNPGAYNPDFIETWHRVVCAVTYEVP